MRGLTMGALLASVLAAGCDSYTYFTVYPGLDNSVVQATKEEIATCSLFILADSKVLERKDVATYDEFGHPTPACQPGSTPSGVWGSLNYSTGRKSGSIEFVLNGYAKSEVNKTTGRVPMVQGTSGPRDVSPGNEVGNGSDRIEVLAKACNGNCPIKDLDR